MFKTVESIDLWLMWMTTLSTMRRSMLTDHPAVDRQETHHSIMNGVLKLKGQNGSDDL